MINNNNIGGFPCPLCEGDMEYRLENNTHIWVCIDCPCVTLEYYEPKDINNLEKAIV